MDFSDNERRQFPPNSIPATPFFIALDQPNRISSEAATEITNMSHSKLIADIFTPTGAFSLLYVDSHKGEAGQSYVVLAPSLGGALLTVLEPGEEFELGEGDNMCAITFHREGTVSVSISSPDPAYLIFAHQAGDIDAPADANYNDDPEL
jgi:hypothetical protein